MSTTFKIPNGDEKVTVELTVKEMMALSGIRFHDNRNLETAARKKLNDALEEAYDIEARKDTIPYDMLS
ncbi:hypothetical protein AB6A23_20370 [Paenibacillus tarimensis]